MTDSDNKRPAPRADDRLTRVPVHHVYFHDSMTFPDIGSGYSTLSNLKCYPEPANNKNHATCEWIPAWQTFEFTFHSSGENAVPKVRGVPACHVHSWTPKAA